MSETIDTILRVIGVVATALAAAFALFKWFGQKWVEDRFARGIEEYRGEIQKDLAKLRHEQEDELEQSKYRINALYSRVSKIHEKEFEVLPIAWNKLVSAQGYLFSLHRTSFFGPSFLNNTEEKNKQYLATTRLTDEEQLSVVDAISLARSTNNPNYSENVFYKLLFWHEFSDAQDAVNDFHNYILFNRIFMSKDLFDQFQIVDKFLLGLLSDFEVAKRLGNIIGQDELRQARDDVQAVLDRIEQIVQGRLHFSES